MGVLAPHGEVAKTLPMLRLATHKLIVLLLGLNFLNLAGKHMATVLLNFVLAMLCKDSKALSQTLQG